MTQRETEMIGLAGAAQRLSLLEGVRESGKGWIARCPAHDARIEGL